VEERGRVPNGKKDRDQRILTNLPTILCKATNTAVTVVPRSANSRTPTASFKLGIARRCALDSVIQCCYLSHRAWSRVESLKKTRPCKIKKTSGLSLMKARGPLPLRCHQNRGKSKRDVKGNRNWKVLEFRKAYQRKTDQIKSVNAMKTFNQMRKANRERRTSQARSAQKRKSQNPARKKSSKF